MDGGMNHVATALPASGVFRHSARDAALPVASVVSALALIALSRSVLAIPLIAIHVWWTSNTIAHIHMHTPIFQRRGHNRAFSIWLSIVTLIPQTIWKQRHLSHHAGRPVGRAPGIVIEMIAIAAAVVAIALTGRLIPIAIGYSIGLLLCQLQGVMEHDGDDAVSHYGALYNFFWFNDGHHVEHHTHPTMHWTQLSRAPHTRASTWPPFLRWIEGVASVLGWLEKLNFGSSLLRGWIVRVHREALARALAGRDVKRIAIVGGGLFPRTVLALQSIVPDAELTVIDASAHSIAIARMHLGETSVRFLESAWDERHDEYDLVIFPLAYVGDRAALYRGGRSPRLIHDWIWRGSGSVVSILLLKRLNVVA
jgi:hypothetical protein